MTFEYAGEITSATIENETVYKYIVSDEDLGFTFVMLYGSVNDLPNECNFIIENSRDYSGVYILDQPYDVTRNITFDIITRNAAENFARYISGLTVSEMADCEHTSGYNKQQYQPAPIRSGETSSVDISSAESENNKKYPANNRDGIKNCKSKIRPGS